MTGDAHQVGAIAMIALAIFDSGPKSDQAVQAATQYLLKTPAKMTKEVALQTLFLQRIGKPGAALQRQNMQWLVDAQIKDGPNAGSWSYRRQGAVESRGDGANTAYAILALSVAAPTDADSDNAVPKEVWQRAERWLLNSQKADGGWGYVPQIAQTTGAMTACGLAGLKALEPRLEKSPQRQAAIKRAQSWLSSRWSTATNPGGGGRGRRAWRMFYLHWASIALRDHAKLGDRNWRSEMLEHLLKSQQKNGSFRGSTPASTPAISTAFALEILKQIAAAKPD